jgi:hypothetical protein
MGALNRKEMSLMKPVGMGAVHTIVQNVRVSIKGEEAVCKRCTDHDIQRWNKKHMSIEWICGCRG